MSVLRSQQVSVRRVLTVVALAAAWCALWGSFHIGNLLGGVVVATAALRLGTGRSRRGGVRLGPLARFAWLVLVDLVVSTATVVREVLTPTDRTDEGIVAIPLPAGARDHLLLLFVAITVTPGTAVVAAEEDASALYLHVLHCDRRDDVEAHVRHLAELACRALPIRSTAAGVPS